MATLAVASAPKAGGGVVVTSNTANAGGDVIPNDGRTIVEVTNGGGSSTVVTFTATGVLASGAAVKDVATTVAASATRVFGPFPPEQFNNSVGQVAVGYSVATSVTVRCISVPG